MRKRRSFFLAVIAAVFLTLTAFAAESAEAPPADGIILNKAGVVLADETSLYAQPSEESEVLAPLAKDAEVTVVSITGEWCEVEHGEQKGYVSGLYVSVDGLPLVDPKGTVTGSCVNVRSIPSTDGSILTKVYAGKTVDLVGLEDGWYAVSIDGTTGYIRGDYIRIRVPNAVSGIGAEIAAAAQDYLGVRYTYGGASPKGFDCSGFTMYVYSLFGYSLPHSATSQWKSSGEYVERSDLQPGDLVLFCDPSESKGKACSHVGIYIGDGDFIHATSSRTGYVKVDNLSQSYYNNYYVGAKRVA